MSNWPECELAGEVREGGKASGTPYIEANHPTTVTLIYAERFCKVSRFYVTLDTCQACPVPALIAAARDALKHLRSLYPYAARTEPIWHRDEVEVRDKLGEALAAIERQKIRAILGRWNAM